jgi:hypothetical protein
MLTEKLWIFMRIYKQFDPSFSLICYYSFIFGLLRISIGLSVFGFIANEYQQRAIWLLSTIHNIWSAIWWAITKVILIICAYLTRILQTKKVVWDFYQVVDEQCLDVRGVFVVQTFLKVNLVFYDCRSRYYISKWLLNWWLHWS